MPQPHANQQIFKEQELTCDCRAMCPCAPSGRRGSDSGHGHHHGKDVAQLRLLKPQHPGIRPTRAGAQITNHVSQPLLPDAYVALRSTSTARLRRHNAYRMHDWRKAKCLRFYAGLPAKSARALAVCADARWTAANGPACNATAGRSR